MRQDLPATDGASVPLRSMLVAIAGLCLMTLWVQKRRSHLIRGMSVISSIASELIVALRPVNMGPSVPDAGGGVVSIIRQVRIARQAKLHAAKMREGIFRVHADVHRRKMDIAPSPLNGTGLDKS
jgi:hypothetical protein